jgi:hypothetical protein
LRELGYAALIDEEPERCSDLPPDELAVLLEGDFLRGHQVTLLPGAGDVKEF